MMSWATILPASPNPSVLSVVKHADPAALVRKSLELLGGIETFVKKGQSVLVKPNIGWDRLPEQAATTNPDAVAEVVRLCRNAGAGKVRVLDRTCNQAQRCYRKSKIEEYAKTAGAQVRYVVDSRFVNTSIPQGEMLSSWPIYKDVYDFDVLINMPIVKTHSLCGLTLGMKNLMGVIGGNRGTLHSNFDVKIVDINTVIRPTLTIIDAYRVLKQNGPSGGSLDDVELKETVVAGTDPVAVDACAATLLNYQPDELGYLVKAHQRGLGQIDLDRVMIKEFDFS